MTLTLNPSVCRLATLSSISITTMLFPASAQADLDEVLALLPEDTQLAICAKGVNALQGQWDQFLTAIAMDQVGVPGPSFFFSMAGFGPETMDGDGTFAVAMLKDRWEADEPPVLAFMPVTDYAAWIANFPVTNEGGIDAVTFPNVPEPVYSRSLDGYAVMGADRELVAGYAAAEGGGTFASMMGEQGRAVVERDEVSVIVDFDGLREVVMPGLRVMAAEAMGQMVMMQQMGMGGMGGGMDSMPDAEVMAAMVDGMGNFFFNETRSAVLGMRMSGKGVVADAVLNWNPEGRMAAAFAEAGGSRNLLSHFASDAFLLAMAMDLKSLNLEAVKSAADESMRTALEQAGHDPAILETLGGGEGPESMQAMMMKGTDGMATVIYPSLGGMMAGFLSQTVSWMSGDAETLATAMQESITALNGMETQGITSITSYEPQAVEIDGMTVDQYQVQQQFPPEMAQVQQMQAMMIGGAGMRGFVAKMDDGLLITTSRNRRLLSQLLAVERGEASGLSEDGAIKAIDEMLPADASMRVYLGVGTLLNQAIPMVQMMMPLEVDLEEVSGMPPIGMALSVHGEGMQAGMVLPAPMIRTIVDLAMQAQAMGAGGGAAAEPEMF